MESVSSISVSVASEDSVDDDGPETPSPLRNKSASRETSEEVTEVSLEVYMSDTSSVDFEISVTGSLETDDIEDCEDESVIMLTIDDRTVEAQLDSDELSELDVTSTEVEVPSLETVELKMLGDDVSDGSVVLSDVSDSVVTELLVLSEVLSVVDSVDVSETVEVSLVDDCEVSLSIVVDSSLILELSV